MQVLLFMICFVRKFNVYIYVNKKDKKLLCRKETKQTCFKIQPLSVKIKSIVSFFINGYNFALKNNMFALQDLFFNVFSNSYKEIRPVL